jgi:hypothetical protein
MPEEPAADTLTSAHRRRLREIWRSAGWPSQDLLEAELLAGGWLERQVDAQGRTTLRVSEAGLQALLHSAQRNRQTRSRHERLVEAVARLLSRQGRIAWRGLSLRARVSDGKRERWQMAMPDVYSLRHTSVAAYLQPVVHEIKANRADLLSDLRKPAKRAAYLQMAGALYYVLAEGIAREDEVPPECGVIIARESPPDPQAADPDLEPDPPIELTLLRPAPVRWPDLEAGLPFGVWMALARATPMRVEDEAQLWLGATSEGGGGG